MFGDIARRRLAIARGGIPSGPGTAPSATVIQRRPAPATAAPEPLRSGLEGLSFASKESVRLAKRHHLTAADMVDHGPSGKGGYTVPDVEAAIAARGGAP